MQESWIKVKGFELYSVSDQGKIRNDKTGRILKGGLDKDGYPQLILCKNGSRVNRKVHRLVAEAFVLNPDNKPQVNHIDGNKQNNAASNLEFCTNQENQDHFWRYLNNEQSKANRSNSHKGKGLLSNNPNAKSVIRLEDGKVYKTIKEAAEELNISYMHIGEACKGKRKTSGGYHWSYVKEVI
jgi:hypothetical protein